MPETPDIGDYVIITDRRHPFYGEAARIFGVQLNLFDSDYIWELHAHLVSHPYWVPRAELIFTADQVTKLERR